MGNDIPLLLTPCLYLKWYYSMRNPVLFITTFQLPPSVEMISLLSYWHSVCSYLYCHLLLPPNSFALKLASAHEYLEFFYLPILTQVCIKGVVCWLTLYSAPCIFCVSSSIPFQSLSFSWSTKLFPKASWLVKLSSTHFFVDTSTFVLDVSSMVSSIWYGSFSASN